jgi:hypothetical protein
MSFLVANLPPIKVLVKKINKIIYPKQILERINLKLFFLFLEGNSIK